MVFKKFRYNLIISVVLAGVLSFVSWAGAQDFGTTAVNNGLGGTLSSVDPREMVGRIINIALGFLGAIAVGFIIYAGFLWMSSGGEEEKVSSAKNILKNAVIGLVVIMASWAIATFIITRLSGSIGEPGNYGCTPGASLACGCYSSGLMVCSGDGSWGACVGQNCSSGNGSNPTSCDASTALPGCQAANQICSEGDYCDANTCSCLPKGGIGDSCDTDPISPTCEANNNRCAEFLTCNPSKGCTCDGPPVITGISPVGGFCEEDRNKACRSDSDCATACNVGTPNGSVNNLVTIFGKNFGVYEAGRSQVLFTSGNGSVVGVSPTDLNPACVDTWRDEQIVIAVPEGVSLGAITVKNRDELTDLTNDGYGPSIPDFLPTNISRPGLCQLNPNRGALSSEVSYQGLNLFASQAYFGSYQNNVQALDSAFNQAAGLTGQALTPNINSGTSGSFVEKPSAAGQVRSNFLRFTKESEEGEGSFISSFYPTSGPSGQYVTLRGRGFGGARGASKVFFGTTEAAYDFPDMCLNSVWRDSQVIVKVPANLSAGYQTISVKIGTTTIDTLRLNPNSFMVDPAQPLRSSLCKIEPDRGPASTPVTLWGEYFGVVNGEGLVKFNYDKTATGTIRKDGRADMIETKVPAGSISGPVRVINNSYWGNELNFSVGECRADSDCGTQVCCPANTYKAGRCSQSLESCYIEIPSSVFEWRFSTGFSTSSTTTLPCVGPDCISNDPCSVFTDLGSCQGSSACCYDDKNSKCRSGEQISSGTDLGYCAYYDCGASETPGLNGCASSQPVKNGTYGDINSCEYFCANPPTGPGLSCAGYATSTCVSNICNFPGFSCLLDSGLSGLTPPACGTCCCQPGTVSPLNPDLSCIADQGACSGASRGLFCGCTRDDECGSKESVGCGSGACCEARPEVTGSLPEHLTDKVCRNAVLRVDFNQVMDISTFSNNVLLLEEREYGNGTCPAGTFVVQNKEFDNKLAVKSGSLFQNFIKSLSSRLVSVWNDWQGTVDTKKAVADLPDPSKLYCAIPGLVSGENSGQTASLYFTPQNILSSAANYFFVIKGDEELNSQTGVLSIRQVGMNGDGYFNVEMAPAEVNGFVEGENITFNGRSYKNSHIIKFSTLAEQGLNSGICSVDRVLVSPESYLINTSDNSLDENDVNFNHPSFDTMADRDKLISAYAVSVDDQILQPVTGYFWDWEFSLSNNETASLAVAPVVANLPAGKALVSAKMGVTDGETGVEAKINMIRFKSPTCNSGSCSCVGANCSNNCCNAYLGGDQFKEIADLYVFLCNNPWPPVAANGIWSPWLDNCNDAIGGGCNFYNYKFYYCRDAGATGTLDDLPAIINQAVIRGASSNLVCSADRTPCPAGSISNSCGPDQNGDLVPDGICIWDVLKESYFFRAAAPTKGELLAAVNTGIGGQVKIDWRADALLNNNASQVSSFKIYYLPSGRGAMLAKEIKPTDLVSGTPVCQLSSGKYDCSYLVNGLSNNVTYIFKLSVVNVSRTESELSDEKSAIPTDTTPPPAPSGLQGQVADGTNLRFNWIRPSGSVDTYRLYRGIVSQRYGESFDSAPGANSLSFALDRFSGNLNYFAVSAIDASGNESTKSLEVRCEGSGSEISCSSSFVPDVKDNELN